MKNILKTFSFGVGGVFALLVVGMMFPRAAHALVATLILNVDEPGRIPYTASLTSVATTVSGAQYMLAPTIPTNKRLVIRYVSGYFGANRSAGALEFRTTANTSTSRAYIPTVVSDPTSIAQPTQIYYLGGETPQIFTAITIDPTSFFEVVLSGYLLDCGSAGCSPLAP